MGQRSEQPKNDPYTRYVNWVDSADQSERIKWWSILGGVSVVLVVVASLIPFGGQWLKAFVGVPAALMLFLVSDGFMRVRHAEKGTTPLREKYSPRQRRKFSGIAVAAMVILALVIAPHIPYAVGGTLLLLGVLHVVNFIRMTQQETEYEEAGIIDPRDVAAVPIASEDPDILDEDKDVSWEAYLDDDDFDVTDERRRA